MGQPQRGAPQTALDDWCQMVPASRCCCGCSLRTGVRWIFAYTLLSSIVQLALDVIIIEKESQDAEEESQDAEDSKPLDDEEQAGFEAGAIVMFVLVLGAHDVWHGRPLIRMNNGYCHKVTDCISFVNDTSTSTDIPWYSL